MGLIRVTDSILNVSNIMLSHIFSSNIKTGIIMLHSTAKIINSTINGYDDIGIKVDNSSIKIFYSNITNNEIAILARYGNCLIRYCNIYGNHIAILSQGSAIDARLNYWGNWLGPSILFNLRGNKIFPPVHIKYFPWLFHLL